MHILLTLLAGMLLGIALTVALTLVSGGWYTYRAVRSGDDAEIRRVVEHDGCEPFAAHGFLFARCARFHLPS